jgi:hypothetical protein
MRQIEQEEEKKRENARSMERDKAREQEKEKENQMKYFVGEDPLTAYLRIPELLPKNLEDIHDGKGEKDEIDQVLKGSGAVIAIMKTHPQQPKLQGRAFMALYRAAVAYSRAKTAIIVKHAAIPLICKAMHAFPAEEKMQYRAMRVLAALASASEFKPICLKEKCLDKVIAGMKRHANSEQVQLYGCKLLSTLTKRDATTSKIIEEENSTASEEECGDTAESSNAGLVLRIKTAGGIKILEDAKTNFSGNPQIKKAATKVLGALGNMKWTSNRKIQKVEKKKKRRKSGSQVRRSGSRIVTRGGSQVNIQTNYIDKEKDREKEKELQKETGKKKGKE